MSLDKELFGMVVNGLNNLEEKKCKSFTLKGLDILEASELEEEYLSNYKTKIIHPKYLSGLYSLKVFKK